MSESENEPTTPGARMGDDLQKEYLEEAEHDRLGDRTEEIHREEAAEEGRSSPKRPWWKFWG
jgi:hypothetical protein